MGYNDFYIGLLFGSKALFGCICNPFWGIIVNQYGSRFPLLIGTLIFMISSIVFGLAATSYEWMFLARSCQGIGSAAAFSAGMTFLAKMFSTDEERGEKMGLAMAGIGLAALVGPPIGGGLYTLGGHALPFFVVAGISFLQLVLQVFFVHVAKPLNDKKSFAKICRTSSDEYRVLDSEIDSGVNIAAGDEVSSLSEVAGSPGPSVRFKIPTPVPSFVEVIKPLLGLQPMLIFITLILANASTAVIEFLLPLYLENQQDYSVGIAGLVLIPTTLCYFLLTPVIGSIGGKYGRIKVVWLTIFSRIIRYLLACFFWLQQLQSFRCLHLYRIN